MEIRSFEIRSVDTEARTIEGIAAPYDEVFDAGDFKETFAPGVFADFNADSALPLYAEHDHLVRGLPIGTINEGRSTDDGFVIRASLNSTSKANDVYALLKDGTLKNFSVGFNPGENTYDESSNTVTHTHADLKEVSVVAFPAYKTAGITAVRSANELAVRSDSDTNNERGLSETDMTDINYATAADLAEVRDGIDELSRRFAVLGDNDATPAATNFRSPGEFIKALADNDDSAKMEVRAYTGATTADSHVGNDWKSDLLVVVDRGRPTLNLFNQGPLGPSGNTVEYPYISATTGDVASQAAEGDNLAYLEVQIATATAPVLTYGGYSELSRQTIERSDVSYLDSVLRFQAASYGKVTNNVVRTALTGAAAQSGTSFTLASATAGDFIKAVVNGVAKIDANGQGAQAEFVLVSGDVAEAAATVLDTNGSQIFNNGIAGLPVKVDTGLAAKTMYIASSAAITTWESAGAPVRLEDENIINLTKQFSLYGYMAVGVTNAVALVKPTIS